MFKVPLTETGSVHTPVTGHYGAGSVLGGQISGTGVVLVVLFVPLFRACRYHQCTF